MSLFREGLVDALAQGRRVWGMLAIVAIGCVAPVLFDGYAAARLDAMSAELGRPEVRMIVYRAPSSSALFDISVPERIRMLDDVDEVFAFSRVIRVFSSSLPFHDPLDMRVIDGMDPPTDAWGRAVWLDEPAWDALGAQTGSVLDEVGEAFVPFRITLPERLERFRSTVMLPRADAPQDQPGWDTLVVGVVALDRVGRVDDAIQPLLRGDGGAPIAAETSLQLVDATRRLADADGRLIRLLALLCAGINAILTAIVFTTVASARRKDLGRRRALGASRHVIFRILIFGYSGLVAAAAATGVAVGLLVSWIAFDTAASTVIGVAVLAQSCGIAFLVLSPLALLAARRDPVRELRLP